MHRINTPQDVVETGVVQVDAGAGVTIAVPLAPSEDGGGVSPDHPLLYMSGVRNVAGDLLTGWAPATTGVRLSRQGFTVTLALDVTRTGELLNARSAGVEPSFAEIIPIPAGFQPIMPGFIQPGKTSTNGRAGAWFDRIATNLRIRDLDADIPTGTRLTNVITWQTIDPIPTSLPGKPA